MKSNKTWIGIYAMAMMAVNFAVADNAVIKDKTSIGQTPQTTHTESLVLVEAMPDETSVLYADGRVVQLPAQRETRFFCGSDVTGQTIDDLREIITNFDRLRASDVPVQVVTGDVTRGGGLTITWNVTGSPPAGFTTALGTLTTYYAGLFSDPLAVSIDVDWTPLSGGVLGATGANTLAADYDTIARPGLVNGMDADDTIQNYLPIGATYPVYYDTAATTPTAEDRLRFTRANYLATIGTTTTSIASMVINSNVNWDYDESNGVGFRIGLQSVLAHEVGHALGFTSNADNASTTNSVALDIYRFQSTDGIDGRNPDTLNEFMTAPRLVDFNNPNNGHISDLISVNYRMADGNPWQASHFNEETPTIGIMDPAMGNGESFWPDYLQASDLHMFDAIGWDFVWSTCANPGDIDNDGDVDLKDAQLFQTCFDPNNAPSAGCECADVVVEDDRVNGLDWQVIVDSLLTGP